MKFIAGWIGEFLQLIYGLVGNYGIALIILTLIVKLILYPLYATQIKSTARMASVQPKMMEIQKKYANDQTMMNQKMQELYKEEHYNPMMGCLPMLIQMPIIWALFMLLRNPLTYMPGSMIIAVHESFLWITDLSQPDKWLLPIAAGIATYISFTMQQSQQSIGVGNNSANGMMKGMKYIFPVMIVWMARSFPAGLAIYWFFGQFIQIFFNLRLNYVKKKMGNESKKK